jgi:lysyl-tRNA synthetase class 2
MSSGSASDAAGWPDDFAPTATWEVLRRRAELLGRIRQFFQRREFLEVETPLLSRDTVVDRHLDPVAVGLSDTAHVPSPGSPHCPQAPMWLQTSPELAMKRLLAAGGTALYQITRSFRGGESGRRHNLEFTIVEWYRVKDTPEQAMDLLSELAEATLKRGPAERLTYQEAFRQHVGVDPHAATNGELRAAVAAHGLAAPDGWSDDDRDSWLNLLLSELVEPRLGRERPTILRDYPASQAALARIRPGPPAVAERFELYVDGLELANGYHELLDDQELRRRNRLANQQRVQDGKPPLPEESRLLAAMRHGLPDCCGVALGFDRLVMCATGASEIAQVLAFPIDRA